ncbi:TonB-dependent receptor [Fulvivirga sediminis]|uniref:TonB-dependent receptor n=1 Tax=Fulvivirga sediminis TaxID=2803949 RepID=A0A937F5Y6_9BACT|nr:TonB-dependent receptor [Fulvivirga sediminis]MBL3654915.1 TonB-dependent receptor [Fulvivirga sediminis]
MKQFLQLIIFSLSFIMIAQVGFSQGVTTAAINGRVVDANKEPLPGATVVAVHVPTGTKYGAITNVEGYYYFPTVRVGGPYKITSSFVGYSEKIKEGISLALGEKLAVDFVMQDESQTLEEVTITADVDETMNSGRTGATTEVSESTIEKNPSISRSISDFARLTPQAAQGVGNGGTSISGRNSRYNNVTIDGAVNNDAFGLNADGQPGSNAGTEPISLDAIKEVSIQVAPYDVTQGSFTGGGINAVTRSGSNEFEGSVYYYTRNENLTGKTIEDNPQKQPPFFNKQYGFRVGGPLVKNKLFFFTSVEKQREETPFTVNLVDQNTLDRYGDNVPSNVSNISVETAQSVKDYLLENYDYDAGSYGAFTPKTENTKLFGRLDWNINNKNQLTLRHNYVKSSQDNISRSQNELQFTNNGYVADFLSNSTILELTSRFSENISNNLILGYSSVENIRNIEDQTADKLFPQVEIDLFDGTTILAGTQRSSVGNELYQDIWQLTDNLTIFKNKHVITVGTHNELFKIKNSFVNRYNGHYEYDGIDNFLNNSTDGRNGRFRTAYSLDYFNDRFQPVELSFLQTGFYIQDEWEVSPNVKLTGGLRLDIPFFLDDPSYNQQFDNDFGLDTRDLPSGQLLWSPRVGFNYDVKGDKTLQLRGGAGIFTGRIPFVWVSNQYTNSGASFGLISVSGRDGNSVPLAPDGNRTLEYYYANQLGVDVNDPAVENAIQELISSDAGASEINVMDPDYKLPQIFRMNLAMDVKLPYGVIGTVEGIFSKGINETKYENINLTDPDEVLPAEGNRPVQSSRLQNPEFGNVLLITNTNQGYQYSISGVLKKTWMDKLSSFIAYTYGVSKDVNSGTHTTALSGWEYNPTPGYSNVSNLSYSQWDLRHRVVGNLNYTQNWSNFTSTSIGLYYNGQSGAPFTYMVNGDLNGDGAYGNDQAYIPASQNEIILQPGDDDNRTPDQIWNELNAFIEGHDYLRENRGKIAERNGARTPWYNRFDLRVMQEFKVMVKDKKNRIQLTMDIENVGNLLNKDWGRAYSVSYGTYNLLQFRGIDEATGRGIYRYSDREDPWNVDNLASVWRMQLGLRYIFGN